MTPFVPIALALIQAAASADLLIDPDAYAVYSIHLSGARPERRVVPAPLIIQATTESWDPPNCFPEPLKPEWEEVLAAYRRQNAKSWTVQRRLQLDAPYELVSKEAIRASFGPDANWEAFDRAHPGSGGYIMLSAVGFNAAKTRAMFYAGYSCGNLCGAGTVHFFEKADGTWKRVTPMSTCAYVS
jgi:hypothetical protein